jgi:MFS superfamily sulfate permease-like transporter
MDIALILISIVVGIIFGIITGALYIIIKIIRTERKAKKDYQQKKMFEVKNNPQEIIPEQKGIEQLPKEKPKGILKKLFKRK